MKKVLFVLSAALILTLLVVGMSLSASAEVVGGDFGRNNDNAKWSLDTTTGVLTISGQGSMGYYVAEYEYSEKIPWFSYRNEIFEIIVEDGITDIINFAFASCANAMSVQLPDSVTTIGDHAFDGCSSLMNVVISENSGLTDIGDYAFSGCSSLTSIEILNGVTRIGAYTFGGCYSLSSIEIPAGVGIPNLHPLKNNGVF